MGQTTIEKHTISTHSFRRTARKAARKYKRWQREARGGDSEAVLRLSLLPTRVALSDLVEPERAVHEAAKWRVVAIKAPR